MPKRKFIENPIEPIRARVTIPPDGDGVFDYLQAINPAALNSELVYLVRLGYQFRSMCRDNRDRPESSLPKASAVTEARADGLETGSLSKTSKESSKQGEAPAARGGAGVNQFRALFGAAHRESHGMGKAV
jgi:hypothetical protein